MTEEPQKSQDEEVNRSISAMLARCQAAADEREQRFSAMLGDSEPPAGPCPDCGKEQDCDREASIGESVRMNRLVILHPVCEPCQRERETRDRLQGYGVPKRVRHATFSNFERWGSGRGKQNAAVASIQEWLADDSAVFLLLIGSCGTGKGHLAAATIRESGSSARWRTHQRLIESVHGADFREREGILSPFKRSPIFVLDELGGKNATADTPEILYGILDKRYDEGAKTIITGNIPVRSEKDGPSVIGLCGGERIESRLSGASVVGCRWGDYRKKP